TNEGRSDAVATLYNELSAARTQEKMNDVILRLIPEGPSKKLEILFTDGAQKKDWTKLLTTATRNYETKHNFPSLDMREVVTSVNNREKDDIESHKGNLKEIRGFIKGLKAKNPSKALNAAYNETLAAWDKFEPLALAHAKENGQNHAE